MSTRVVAVVVSAANVPTGRIRVLMVGAKWAPHHAEASTPRLLTLQNTSAGAGPHRPGSRILHKLLIGGIRANETNRGRRCRVPVQGGSLPGQSDGSGYEATAAGRSVNRFPESDS